MNQYVFKPDKACKINPEVIIVVTVLQDSNRRLYIVNIFDETVPL